MVDKRFQYNPRYWIDTHRTLSEAYRDAEYCSPITKFANHSKDEVLYGFLVGAGAILSMAFMFYFEQFVEFIRYG